MKIKMKPSLKGYITLHRGIQKLLKEKSLDLTSFGAFLGFALQADWDKNHSTYRCLKKTDAEIADEWGLNHSTVFRRRKDLIDKGFLKVREDGFTEVPLLYFELSYNQLAAAVQISPMQKDTADSKEVIEDFQQDVADKQID